METIVVTIKRVKLFVDENSANVQLTFDKTIKGFVQNDEGDFIETDVKSISIPRSNLTAQLCEVSDDIAMYLATLDHKLGQKEFGVILFNAKLKINRDRKVAGEIIGEGDKAKALERDSYITDIVGVTLSDRALRQLDDATRL